MNTYESMGCNTKWLCLFVSQSVPGTPFSQRNPNGSIELKSCMAVSTSWLVMVTPGRRNRFIFFIHPRYWDPLKWIKMRLEDEMWPWIFCMVLPMSFRFMSPDLRKNNIYICIYIYIFNRCRWGKANVPWMPQAPDLTPQTRSKAPGSWVVRSPKKSPCQNHETIMWQ